jgi:hypothetical protein
MTILIINSGNWILLNKDQIVLNNHQFVLNKDHSNKFWKLDSLK